MTTKPRFETAAYVRSHGKQPKGWGMWGFFFEDTADRVCVWAGSCSYSEAKKWAAKEARRENVQVVSVAP